MKAPIAGVANEVATVEPMMIGPDAQLQPELLAGAEQASTFLKGLANRHRLLVLCALVDGERSVSELEILLKLRQPTLSQQLARLRHEGMVATRRHGKVIYYRLASSEARRLIGLLHELFCAPLR